MKHQIQLHNKIESRIRKLDIKNKKSTSPIWTCYVAGLNNGREIFLKAWGSATFISQVGGKYKIDHNATDNQIQKALNLIDAYETYTDIELAELEIKYLIHCHNWSYKYSGGNHYRQGRAQRLLILDRLSKLDFEKAKKLWNSNKDSTTEPYSESHHNNPKDKVE